MCDSSIPHSPWGIVASTPTRAYPNPSLSSTQHGVYNPRLGSQAKQRGFLTSPRREFPGNPSILLSGSKVAAAKMPLGPLASGNQDFVLSRPLYAGREQDGAMLGDVEEENERQSREGNVDIQKLEPKRLGAAELQNLSIDGQIIHDMSA